MKFNKNSLLAVIIVIVFVILAVALFFLLRNFYQEPQIINDQIPVVDSEIKQLTFEEDAERFLQVYFLQPFETIVEKKKFVDREYSRFSFMNVSDENIKFKKELVDTIKLIKEKYEINNLNFETEHDILLALWDEL
ncbi:hypothetical protein HN958_03925 [Candidatus Falkowbacteria bacterium]|jgi:hypothetical protein|nr:hypothetical protein [Candidatus Falkowbacteria bacterium]MBT7007626.1 hypothetical protein [Candidatus Falkowbacteria bacterium]